MPHRMPIREAADFLGVSIDTVRRRLRRGELRGQLVDGHWVIEIPESLEPARTDTQYALRILEGQLQVKDEQIARLTALLETLTGAKVT